MSSPLPIASETVGLAAQLKARLRPMFAEPVILVDPSDPVIGGPQCIAAACERLAVLEDTCSAHHQRWMKTVAPRLERGRQRSRPSDGGCNSPASARLRPAGGLVARSISATLMSSDGTAKAGRTWKAGSEGAAVAHRFHRGSVVTFRAVNLMPKAALGYVGTTGIGGAALAVRRLTRGC